MPSIKFNNPLRSLDLTTADVRKVVTPAAKIARDAAYVAVGVGVIATQQVNARRYDLRQRVNSVQQRLSETAPRVRDEAQETAQRVIDEAQATARRVIDEATSKVRSVVARRKDAAADTIG